MRICRVATVPFSLVNNLGEQIRFLANARHTVDLVCSRGPGCDELAQLEGVRLHIIEIPRKIAPVADALALIRLYRLFRRSGYEIVHSTTPKAGFLCALAGHAAGIPIRLHTFTGQPWTELQGILRWVAKNCDRAITGLNTQCYTDSRSQREFLIAEGIGDDKSLRVLGAGSLAGVDVDRWERAREQYRRDETWIALGLPPGVPMIVFVGRVTRDKGIVELIDAFDRVIAAGVDCYLVIVGPFEKSRSDEVKDALARAHGNARVRLVGYDPAPERIMAVAEILCLPSYREGFGNVVLEAAAMGIPTVGTAIVGLTDSIVTGVTGLLVPPKNPRALGDALLLLLRDTDLRKRMGQAARNRAVQLFDAAQVNELMLREYERYHGRIRVQNGRGQ